MSSNLLATALVCLVSSSLPGLIFARSFVSNNESTEETSPETMEWSHTTSASPEATLDRATFACCISEIFSIIQGFSASERIQFENDLKLIQELITGIQSQEIRNFLKAFLRVETFDTYKSNKADASWLVDGDYAMESSNIDSTILPQNSTPALKIQKNRSRNASNPASHAGSSLDGLSQEIEKETDKDRPTASDDDSPRSDIVSTPAAPTSSITSGSTKGNNTRKHNQVKKKGSSSNSGETKVYTILKRPQNTKPATHSGTLSYNASPFIPAGIKNQNTGNSYSSSIVNGSLYESGPLYNISYWNPEEAIQSETTTSRSSKKNDMHKTQETTSSVTTPESMNFVYEHPTGGSSSIVTTKRFSPNVWTPTSPPTVSSTSSEDRIELRFPSSIEISPDGFLYKDIHKIKEDPDYKVDLSSLQENQFYRDEGPDEEKVFTPLTATEKANIERVRNAQRQRASTPDLRGYTPTSNSLPSLVTVDGFYRTPSNAGGGLFNSKIQSVTEKTTYYSTDVNQNIVTQGNLRTVEHVSDVPFLLNTTYDAEGFTSTTEILAMNGTSHILRSSGNQSVNLGNGHLGYNLTDGRPLTENPRPELKNHIGMPLLSTGNMIPEVPAVVEVVTPTVSTPPQIATAIIPVHPTTIHPMTTMFQTSSPINVLQPPPPGYFIVPMPTTPNYPPPSFRIVHPMPNCPPPPFPYKRHFN